MRARAAVCRAAPTGARTARRGPSGQRPERVHRSRPSEGRTVMRGVSQARPVTIAGVAVVVALIVGAGCSDDDGTDAPASAPELGGTTSTSAAEPTGEPITIGFVNSEGGAFSVPELRVGNEVAAEYVNSHLGGVAGRPLEVVRCATDGSPESSIDCANQLVESGAVAV